ncbi:hypothetical protein HDU93_002860, partial [Gonapodya sp. JEL0774]
MSRRPSGRYELTTPLSVWRESHGGLSPPDGTPSLDHRRALLPARLRKDLADHPTVEQEHGPKEVHLRSFVDAVGDLVRGFGGGLERETYVQEGGEEQAEELERVRLRKEMEDGAGGRNMEEDK